MNNKKAREEKTIGGIRRDIDRLLGEFEQKIWLSGYQAGSKDAEKKAETLSEDEKAELRGEGVIALHDALFKTISHFAGDTEDEKKLKKAIIEAVAELADMCPVEFVGKADEYEDVDSEECDEECENEDEDEEDGDAVMKELIEQFAEEVKKHFGEGNVSIKVSTENLEKK